MAARSMKINVQVGTQRLIVPVRDSTKSIESLQQSIIRRAMQNRVRKEGRNCPEIVPTLDGLTLATGVYDTVVLNMEDSIGAVLEDNCFLNLQYTDKPRDANPADQEKEKRRAERRRSSALTVPTEQPAANPTGSASSSPRSRRDSADSSPRPKGLIAPTADDAAHQARVEALAALTPEERFRRAVIRVQAQVRGRIARKRFEAIVIEAIIAAEEERERKERERVHAFLHEKEKSERDLMEEVRQRVGVQNSRESQYREERSKTNAEMKKKEVAKYGVYGKRKTKLGAGLKSLAEDAKKDAKAAVKASGSGSSSGSTSGSSSPEPPAPVKKQTSSVKRTFSREVLENACLMAAARDEEMAAKEAAPPASPLALFANEVRRCTPKSLRKAASGGMKAMGVSLASVH